MPQPSEPPNRVPLLQANGLVSPEWAQWFTSMQAALNSRQLYIPAIDGAPAFTPEDRPDFVPLVYDETNDALYAYNGGWVSVSLS